MLPFDSPLADGDVLALDGRHFTVRVSTRRKRLGLTVERDGSLTLRVPEGCDRGQAEDFVRHSRRWIENKLRLQQRHLPLNPSRKFRDGEIFQYLGRDHRLSLVVGAPGTQVRLFAGELLLDEAAAADPVKGKRAVADWYCKAGLRWATGRTQPWAGRMDVPEPELEVRDVGRRWGTYRSDGGAGAGRMALHWAVFQLPPRLVDYVIAHELAHIKISGHGPEYWRLLRRAIPECEALKTELDEMGRRVWLGDVLLPDCRST